jgi:hypothetical protein
MRPDAVTGHRGAGSVRKSDSGTARFSDSTLATQALTAASPLRSRGPVLDVLADLHAACDARAAPLAGAFADPDVLADRRAIAAEGAP